MNEKDWLDTATKKIRFRPDRKAVRRELEAHLEDLREVSGLGEEDALQAMGDPNEIAEELGRVHKPWLGYLWRVSQLALAGAAVTSYPARGRFFTSANASVRRLEEGPSLLCVSMPAELRDEFGQPLGYAAYVAVHPPEDAGAAVLTLHVDEGDYAVEGIREGELFLFYASPEPDEEGRVWMNSSWFWPGKLAYEMVFFDEDGNSICQVSS